MTKLKALKGMQIYFSVPWSRKPLTLRRGPPWQDNVANLSLPQLRAAYALAKAAHEFAYGVKGKILYKGLRIPKAAFVVAQAVPKGPGVHEGMTPEERRAERHAAAEATLAYLESLIRAKGGTPPTITRPAVE